MERHYVLAGLGAGLTLGGRQDHVVPSSRLLVRLVHLRAGEGIGLIRKVQFDSVSIATTATRIGHRPERERE